jgi:peptide/nickel transport system substrate-binding protein
MGGDPMMKRLLDFRYIIVLLALTAGMVAIACSEEEEPAPAPTTAPAPAPTEAPAPAPTAAPAPAPTEAPAPAPTMMDGPVYGGTFTSITTREPSSWDPRVGACDLPHFVYDDLGQGDWTVPREEFSYTGFYVPEQYRVGALAESWEQPDLGTIRFKIREDAVWHDKAPANGREVTAEDVAYSWSAYTGTGMGFTEPHPSMQAIWEPITSVTALDDDTVEFKFEPLVTMLGLLLTEGVGDSVVNKESLEEHGDLENWEHALGSGPFVLTEVVEGTSYTWEKNPNWWGEDPRYPGNQLPYIDTFRLLDLRDWAAQKAAYRTGKVDELGGWASVVTITPSQVDSIIDSNPETELFVRWPEGWGIGMRMDDPDKPWSDIRVRRALQKAIPTEEIANDYYGGYTEPALYPIFGSLVKGFFTPYEEWDAETRANHDYDVEAAKELLAEAGYPDGFEVSLWLGTGEQDPELAQIVKGYLAEIGVDVTIEEMEWGVYWSRLSDGELEEWHWDWTGPQGSPLPRLTGFFTSDAPMSQKFWNDPVVDGGVEKALAATDMEEYTNIIKTVADHIRDQQYRILFPLMANVAMWHPYVEGFNGEWYSGVCNTGYVYAHVWLDPDQKKAMGY